MERLRKKNRHWALILLGAVQKKEKEGRGCVREMAPANDKKIKEKDLPQNPKLIHKKKEDEKRGVSGGERQRDLGSQTGGKETKESKNRRARAATSIVPKKETRIKRPGSGRGIKANFGICGEPKI